MKLSIFCDFDGTITRHDVVDLLLERLADPAWLAIEKEWQDGLIGSRECMSRQIPLIKGGWNELLEVASEVEFDPTFKSFYNWCRLNGVPLTIVSEGLDVVIRFLLEREGVNRYELIANELRYDAVRGFSLSFGDRRQRPAGKMRNCLAGVCKCMCLAQHQDEGYRVVIGDGRSDFCWSEKADILFAKKSLARHAADNRLEFFQYESFDDIRARLQDMLKDLPEAEQLAVS